jgi:hypothetical protein
VRDAKFVESLLCFAQCGAVGAICAELVNAAGVQETGLHLDSLMLRIFGDLRGE